MKSQLVGTAYLVALAIFCAARITPASAVTEKVIYNFPAGSHPYGRLEQDDAGAIYGTSYDQNSLGTIYQLRQKRGVWKAKVLHTFGGSDGAHPYAGLAEDHTTGSFYGVTQYGGSQGNGTAFALTRSGSTWTEKVLHSFTGGSDGAQPEAVLARDKATGALFGTTWIGGSTGCGSAFALTQSGGSWIFNTIYSFHGGTDGCNSTVQLKPGTKVGQWVGATYYGGAASAGTIFRLVEKSGVWSEGVVHTLSPTDDGSNPFDLDASDEGTVYGVAVHGGVYGNGTLFQMTPNRNKYQYTVLYHFTGGSGGANPMGVRLDNKAGNLLVTSMNGGTYGRGMLFSFAPPNWTRTSLHSFGSGSDGAYPESRPILNNTTGKIYGTTSSGGTNNGGTVYEVTP